MQAVQQKSVPNLFGPTLLIGLGLLLLLSNFGYLSFDAWIVIVQLWPLLLIAIGINLLIGRNSRWISALIALLLILVVLAVVWILPGRFGALGGLGEPVTISQPLESLERAELNISSSVGHLTLDADVAPGQLVTGRITPLRNEKVDTQYKQEGDVGRYWLESKGAVSSPSFFFNNFSESEWQIHVSPETPLRLNLSTGVGLSEIDLRSLTVSDLSVNSGVGKTSITLPSQGEVNGKVQAGVGQVILRVPASMAARIQVNPGLGGVNVKGNFTHSDNLYTTSDYQTATNRVALTVEGGVGEVQIERTEE